MPMTKDEFLAAAYKEIDQAVHGYGSRHLETARHFMAGAALADGDIDLNGLSELIRVIGQEIR